MDWIILALFLAIAVASSVCARLTRPERSYWPMLRVMWMALAFAYGGGAIGLAMGAERGTVNPIAFSAAMLAAVLYSAWFMRKRNRTPRFVRLTLGGHLEMIGLDQLEHMATLVESAAHHGVLPASSVAKLEAALPAWHAHQRERLGARMKREALARREGGIPDDD